MTEFILKYWIEMAFTAVIGGLGWMLKKLLSWKHEQDTIKKGLQALLRNEIIQQYNIYQEKEWIPVYALENTLSMYQEYHGLGGNGTVTKLVEELKNLPSIKPNPPDGESL